MVSRNQKLTPFTVGKSIIGGFGRVGFIFMLIMMLIYERRRKLLDLGLEHRFKVDRVPYIIRILYRTIHYDYELWVDGKLQ